MLIATDEFAALARDAGRAQGLPDARIATVTHPIGGIPADALRGRAESAVDTVLELLTGAPEER